MRTIAFKIDEELLEQLDIYAKRKGISRSEIIRKAIEFYLRANSGMVYVKTVKLMR